MSFCFVRRCSIALAIIALLLEGGASPQALHAQRVLGPGEDALVLPKGVFQIRGTGDWQSANERYGTGLLGRPKGTLEALGASWSLDSVGVAQLPVLQPLQQGLRALTGNSTLNVSLGRTILARNNRISRIPISIDAGLTRRLTIGIMVPIVQTVSDISFSVNPSSNEGNIALNPALTNAADLNADTLFINQMQRAANAVSAYCAGAGAGQPQCATGAALATEALAFANGLNEVYPSALFIPIHGSDVQTQIDSRAASLRGALNAFVGLPGSTVAEITGTGVTGAIIPLSTTDVKALVMDPQFGIQADSIATISRWELGDIELNAKFLLFNSFDRRNGVTTGKNFVKTVRTMTNAEMNPSGFNTRVSIGGMVRIPTGRSASPDNLLDISGSTDAWAFGVRGYVDMLMGPRFWTSLIARYDIHLSGDQERRISDTPDQILLPLYRRATVNRKLGNLMELEVTPRWVFNDFISISAQYAFRNKAKDSYTGTQFTVGPDATTGGETIVVTPNTLGIATEFTEHRFGGGFAFSNLRAYQQRKANIPFEVTFLHSQTIKGSGGNLPKTFTDQIQMRLYVRVLGN